MGRFKRAIRSSSPPVQYSNEWAVARKHALNNTRDYGAAKGEHFHPKGKMPSEHAINILEALRKMLPFSDTRDFDEEKKRFIAAPNSWLRQ